MNTSGTEWAIFTVLLQYVLIFPIAEGWGRFNNCKECGKYNIEPAFSYRIVGGEEVNSPMKYPWMIAISSEDSRDSERIMCGGALISSLFVLTAAHCLMNEKSRHAERCYPVGNCYQKANDVLLYTWHNSTLRRRLPVSGIVPHPEFRFDGDVLTHDIALIRLEYLVACNSHLFPICLPNFDMSNIGGPLTVAGWGDTKGSGHDKNQILREGTVTQISPKLCMDKGQSTAPAREIICTVSGYTKQVGCYGDSGTPIFGTHNGVYYTLGVTVDHTSKTCDPAKPMIYTKVFAYWGWIKGYVRYLPKPRKLQYYGASPQGPNLGPSRPVPLNDRTVQMNRYG